MNAARWDDKRRGATFDIRQAMPQWYAVYDAAIAGKDYRVRLGVLT